MLLDELFRDSILLLGMLIILVFMSALGLILLSAVRTFIRGADYVYPTWGSTKSLAILKERYARGELSKDEYDNMLHSLIS